MTQASKSSEGTTFLSVDPIDLMAPIAVGDNDPRLQGIKAATAYGLTGNGSTDDASALDTLVNGTLQTYHQGGIVYFEGSDDAETRDYKIGSSIAIPANVILRFGPGARLQVSSGAVVTINSMEDAGSRQIFVGPGKVVFNKNAVAEMNFSWWAGITSSGDDRNAFEQARQSLNNNLGGILKIPPGVWKTTSFVPPSGSIIQGSGSGLSETNATVLTLYDLASTDCVVKVSDISFRNIIIRDLTISVATSTTASCLIAEGTAPYSSSGLELNNVTFMGSGTSAPAQAFIKDLGGTWEVINVKFNHCTWFVPPEGTGFKCTTPNCSLMFDQPFFYTAVGAINIHLAQVGSITVVNPTHNGISSVQSITTLNRTVTASVTGTNLTVSSGALTVNDIGQRVLITGVSSTFDSYITAVTGSQSATVEDTAPATVSGSTGIYRSAPPPVTSVNRTVTASITSGTKTLTFVTGAPATLDIGQKVVIAGKLNSYIASINTTTNTATVKDNATGTTTGGGESMQIYRSMAKCAYYISGSHGCINIIGSQDEGFQYFIIVDTVGQLEFPLTLMGNNVQSTILLNKSITVNSIGNHYYSQTYVIGADSGARIGSVNDYVKKWTINPKPLPAIIGVTLLTPRLLGENLGGPLLINEPGTMDGVKRQAFRMPTDFKFGPEFGIDPDPSNPVVGIGSVYSKQMLRIGRLNYTTEDFDYYYDLKRDYEDGRFKFAGNQSEPYKGYDFNADIAAAQRITSGVVALTDEANITTNAKLGNTFTVTLGGNRNLNAPLNPVDGQEITWEIKQDATGSRTLTLATGMYGFVLGSTITSTTLSTGANLTDILKARYSVAGHGWRVILFEKGYVSL
ncbi:MAG TPA: hypothetical protein VGC76_12475 [Pyrinomonadaceae bacterium]